VIADANPKIDDWDRVDPGTVVRLPDVTVID
jgi:phage tail protein X